MIVVTVLLTANPDPQRPRHAWRCDPAIVDTLAGSVEAHGHHFVVLHDEPPTSTPAIGEWVPVRAQHRNPYFARWFAYRDFLLGATGPVWCVDGSDTELLRQPQMAPGVLYAGTDRGDPDDRAWLVDNHPRTVNAPPALPMFNAGLLGGDASDVVEFCDLMTTLANDVDLTDMGAFAIAAGTFGAATDWPHTRYKAFDCRNTEAWWRHK